MVNYKVIGFGIIVTLILLLIILGHIYDFPILYIPGWIGAMIFAINVIYIMYKRKKYIGNNESINGGKCSDIQNYLKNSNQNFDLDWCNFNKTETDKTYLTKKANLALHPNANNQCATEANEAFKMANNECQKIMKKGFLDRIEEWWNSSSAKTTTTSPPTTNKYTSQYTPQYTKSEPSTTKNMSDYELRQGFNVGNQAAMKEMADRRFKNSPVNVKSNPNERPELDFCTIM